MRIIGASGNKNNSGNNRRRVGRGNARIMRTPERRAVGVTSPSVIKPSGIIIHSAHVKMASTSRPEEPDSDASVPRPCLISLSLVNSCFESLSPAAIFGSCRESIFPFETLVQ